MTLSPPIPLPEFHSTSQGPLYVCMCVHVCSLKMITNSLKFLRMCFIRRRGVNAYVRRCALVQSCGEDPPNGWRRILGNTEGEIRMSWPRVLNASNCTIDWYNHPTKQQIVSGGYGKVLVLPHLVGTVWLLWLVCTPAGQRRGLGRCSATMSWRWALRVPASRGEMQTEWLFSAAYHSVPVSREARWDQSGPIN